MKIKITATTDTGKERTNNEDAFIICPDLSQQDWIQNETLSYVPCGRYGALMVVADGMGGANAGEVASLIATTSICRTFSKENIENAINNDDIKRLLLSCIIKADEDINHKIYEDPDMIGMGTTIVVCWIVEGYAHIAWCGDSRCYLYNMRKGLIPLTKDHSLVQELIDKGDITEKEAFTHPYNNVITRALGDVDSHSQPDIISYPIDCNDIILMCSDGLCGYNTNKAIERILDKNYIDIIKCREELMKLALDTGGYDNICIALASLIHDDQSVPTTPGFFQKYFIKLKRILSN